MAKAKSKKPKTPKAKKGKSRSKSKRQRSKGPKSKGRMDLKKKEKERLEAERAEREAREAKERQLQFEREMSQRTSHLLESAASISFYDKVCFAYYRHQKRLREWQVFTACRNLPDFKLNEINSYMTNWIIDLSKPTIENVFRLSPEILQLIEEIKEFLLLPLETVSVDTIKEIGLLYHEFKERQQEFLDSSTYEIIQDLTDYFDLEEGVVDFVHQIDKITLALYGNLFAQPDLLGHNFEKLKFKFKLPDGLVERRGVYRLLKTEYDHYSDNSNSFFAPGTDNALKRSIDDWIQKKNEGKKKHLELLTPPESEDEGSRKGTRKDKKKKGKKKGKRSKKKSKSKRKKKGGSGQGNKKAATSDTEDADLDEEYKKLANELEAVEKRGKKKKKGKKKKGKKGKGPQSQSETTGTETEAEGEDGEEDEDEEEGDEDEEGDEGESEAEGPKLVSEEDYEVKETKEERRARRRREIEDDNDDDDVDDMLGRAFTKTRIRDDDSDSDEISKKKVRGGASKRLMTDDSRVTIGEKQSRAASRGVKSVSKIMSKRRSTKKGKKKKKGKKSKRKKKRRSKRSKRKKKRSKSKKSLSRKSKSRTQSQARDKSSSKTGETSENEEEAEIETDTDAKSRASSRSRSRSKGRKSKGRSKGKKSRSKSKGRSKSKRKKATGKSKSSSKSTSRSRSKSSKRGRSKSKERKGKGKSKSKSKSRSRSKTKSKSKSKSRSRSRQRGRSKKKGKSKSKSRSRSKSKKKKKSKSKERTKTEAELAKERERAEKAKFIPTLSQHELNLRNYTILGGVYHFNWLEIPPQPKERGDWIYHIIESDQRLKEIPFEADFVPPTPPDMQEAKKTPEEMEREAKKQEEELQKLVALDVKLPEIPDIELPGEVERESVINLKKQEELLSAYESEKERRLEELVLVEIDVPRTALWFEPPVPVRWTEDKRIWSTDGFYDIRFNEDQLHLTFRTTKFGIIGLAHNRYSNLPYQSFELRPGGQNKCMFSLMAAMAAIEFSIVDDMVCVSSLQNVSNSDVVEAAVLNKYMHPKELIKILRYHGLDIFPELDSYAYVDGVLLKHIETEEHMYQCMAILSPAYNFHWSRWNLLAGRERMVFQMRERLGTTTPGNYQMVLNTPVKASLIACTEVSPNFSEEPISNSQYHADLLHLAMAYASDEAKNVIKKSNAHFVETVRTLITAVRPVSFS